MTSAAATLDGELVTGSKALVLRADKASHANTIVQYHSIGSGAIAIVPIPPLAVGLILANNLKMLHGLSSVYGIAFRKDLGKSAISSFLVACGSMSISGRLVWGLSTLMPFAAPIISMSTASLMATALTYANGQIFKQHFASGGTFLDFDPEKVRDHYAELIEEGKKLHVKKATKKRAKKKVAKKTAKKAATK